MIKVLKGFIFLVFVFLLTNCAAPDPVRTNEFTNKKASFKTITYDANMRSIFITKKSSKLKFCAEPPPDSTESFQEGLSAKVSAVKEGEGIGAEEGTSSSSLGGRNGTVLLAREILFRACELGANYNASYEQQAGMFVRALESIEKIADESQAKGPITKALSSQAMWNKAPTSGVSDRVPSSQAVDTSSSTNPSTDDSSVKDSDDDDSSDDTESDYD